jgi:hypothetical protein
MDEGWEEVTAVHPIHLQPCYLNSTKELLEEGVKAYLNTYLYKYDQGLKCIPLAYSRIDWSMAGPFAAIIGDSPRAHFEVRVRWTGFVPTPGLEVTGRVVSIDGTGMTLSLLDEDLEIKLCVLVSASDLRGEWTWESSDGWNSSDSLWKPMPTSRNRVPNVNELFTVVVLGPGGPTGILAKLPENKSKHDN